MTNYLTIDEPKKISRKTVFTHRVGKSEIVKLEYDSDIEFDNMMWLGFDHVYGDVFKVWKNDSSDFTIYFGTKGDEFNK